MKEVKKIFYNVSTPTFGEIKKMPVPMDTATNRDEEFKQKIIDYEKNTIEPALTKLIQDANAGARIPIVIKFGDTAWANIYQNNAVYRIADDEVPALGGNRRLILEIIGKQYQQEGYNNITIKDGREGILLIVK